MFAEKKRLRRWYQKGRLFSMIVQRDFLYISMGFGGWGGGCCLSSKKKHWLSHRSNTPDENHNMVNCDSASVFFCWRRRGGSLSAEPVVSRCNAPTEDQ